MVRFSSVPVPNMPPVGVVRSVAAGVNTIDWTPAQFGGTPAELWVIAVESALPATIVPISSIST